MSEEERSEAERAHPPPPPEEGGLGGVARLAVSAWWNTAGWTLGSSVKATRRLAQAATSAESAASLAQDVRETARGYVRDLAGVADIEERVRSAVPDSGVARTVASAIPRSAAVSADVGSGRSTTNDVTQEDADSLANRGELLLRRSADVRYEEKAHPAYERILYELAPDEARILRLLLVKGPQPAVDVRTGGPLGLVSSKLIAPGLSMIGAQAGCRYLDRVPSYLNNLNRLGLIWFSRETLRDPLQYQVVEAQPDVLEAMHSVRQAKVVRRSIHLTPFGEDFCRDCLSLGGDSPEELPEHGSPAKPTEVSSPPPAA